MSRKRTQKTKIVQLEDDEDEEEIPPKRTKRPNRAQNKVFRNFIFPRKQYFCNSK